MKGPKEAEGRQQEQQNSNGSKSKAFFERFSGAITRGTGKPYAFLTALGVVVVWAVSGPFFNYSETWQLIINTGTTIITFLMVFLIQQAQNKDTVALHLKLNELIAANKRASNRLINVEDLTEDELVNLKNFFVHLSNNKMQPSELFAQHSIDEEQLKETAEDLADQLHEQIEKNADDPEDPPADDTTAK